jgi:nifR3 family TIM-barrel protein
MSPQSTIETGRLPPSPQPIASAVEDPQITIGGRVLPTRYFLAPLAGYTQLPFRTVIRQLGGLGLATTDLVLAGQLLSGSKKSRELIATSPDDRSLAVQIFSGHTDELVRAAKHLERIGFESIDINMGCPMAKVNSQGGGARLMCDLENARDTAARVVDAVQIPVTVKMRLGWDRESLSAPTLAREFERVGVAAITVHGRTRQQGFGGTVNLDAIRATVEAVDQIPVIGNGDVRTAKDALKMRRVTGCAAVAIGRGALIDPWIFKRIERVTQGITEPFEPTADEKVDFLQNHFRSMFAHRGTYSCILFRKFAGWYGSRLGIPEELEDRLRQFESTTEFDEIVAQIRRRHGERKTSVPTALVKVPNGPVERW